MWRFVTLIAVIALALSAIPGLAADNEAQGWQVNAEELAFDADEAHPSTRRLWGEHEGAGYRIEVPPDWNGTLVLYARPLRASDRADLSVINPPLRGALLDQEIAWAASSFHANGYHVTAGVEDTRALLDVFSQRIRAPETALVIGHDLGGQVTIASMEQYPEDYSGGLAFCAPMDGRDHLNYLLDINLIAHALTDTETRFPEPALQSAGMDEVVQRLGPGFPTTLHPAGDDFRAALRALSGGNTPLFDAAFDAWGLRVLELGAVDGALGGLLPGNLYSNAERHYQVDGGAAEQRLNETILRVPPDPVLERAGIRPLPELQGTLGAPLLLVSALGDLYAPPSLHQQYAQRVDTAGQSALLANWFVRDVGHCTFSDAETGAALDALLAWVEDGNRPQSVDLTDPGALEQDDVGCDVTNPPRAGLPACED